MLRLLNGAFGVVWTAAVTLGGVTIGIVTRNEAIYPRAQRAWARGLLQGWGVDVEVIGAESIDADEPCVVIANHRSHVDVPVLMAALPVVPSFLAKKELEKIPVLATALRRGRHVLVDRSDGGSALRAFKQVASEIQGGKTVVIFPEGTRGDGARLGPMKRGGFLIAKRARVSVVPVAVMGTEHVLPRGRRLPRSGRVLVRVGTVIPARDVRALSASDLRDRVRAELAELTGVGDAEPADGPEASGLSLA